MRIINIVVGIALLLTSASVSARSPYVINGLHTDLALGEARTQAEKLGGTCRNVPSRPNDVSKNVQCEFSHGIDGFAAVDHPVERPGPDSRRQCAGFALALDVIRRRNRQPCSRLSGPLDSV